MSAQPSDRERSYPNVEIQVEEKEGFHRVTPVGELDVYTVPLFRKVVLKLEGDRRHDLILDLSRVTFIDSSGLGSLIETYQKVQSVDGEIVFVLDNPRMMKILRLANLDRVFGYTRTSARPCRRWESPAGMSTRSFSRTLLDGADQRISTG